MVEIKNTNIMIDLFNQEDKIYFLTHMHTDHCKGLGTTWNLGTIYCSETTKILL